MRGRAGRRRLRQGADRQQRRQAAPPDREACRRRGRAPSGPTTTARIPTMPRSSSGRPSSCAPPPRRGAGGWPGISAATPARIRASSRAHADYVVAMDGDPMAIEHSLPAREGRRRTDVDPAARRQSRRRVAEPGLARYGAQGAGGAGTAGAYALPGADPPYRHHGQHPARGVYRLAGGSGNIGRYRVRRTRRRDGSASCSQTARTSIRTIRTTRFARCWRHGSTSRVSGR